MSSRLLITITQYFYLCSPVSKYRCEQYLSIYLVDSFSDSSLSSAAIALLNNHKAEFDTAKVRQSTIMNYVSLCSLNFLTILTLGILCR